MTFCDSADTWNASQMDANLLCRHVPQMSQSWNLQGQALQKQQRFQEAARSYLLGKEGPDLGFRVQFRVQGSEFRVTWHNSIPGLGPKVTS